DRLRCWCVFACDEFSMGKRGRRVIFGAGDDNYERRGLWHADDGGRDPWRQRHLRADFQRLQWRRQGRLPDDEWPLPVWLLEQRRRDIHHQKFEFAEWMELRHQPAIEFHFDHW